MAGYDSVNYGQTPRDDVLGNRLSAFVPSVSSGNGSNFFPGNVLGSLLLSYDRNFFEARQENLNILVFALSGSMDAGRVVENIQQDLLDNLNGRMVAEFDTDRLYSYRERRPLISFVEDHVEDYRPLTLKLYCLVDSLGSPFLFLSGAEPDYNWERLSQLIVGIVEHFGIRLTSWAHSVPMPVPHTRKLGVTAHGNCAELIEKASSWRPVIELGASFGHVIELRLIQSGHAVASYMVHVPHYIADSSYKPAAVAALEHVGAATRLVFPTDRLRDAAREMERQLAEQVEASAEIRTMINGLEERYDEQTSNDDYQGPVSLLGSSVDDLPDGEALASVFEEYLANHRRDGSEGAVGFTKNSPVTGPANGVLDNNRDLFGKRGDAEEGDIQDGLEER